MLKEKLEKYNIILGSSSLRRKKLLSELDLKFTVKVNLQKEDYPKTLCISKIAAFLAKQKSDIISKELSGNYLLITADTIVINNKEILHKPQDKKEALRLLSDLSGKKHKVISSFCIRSNKKEVIHSSITEVFLYKLFKKEILYYVNNFNPYDKAGSYGIQDWIGHIGVEKINGSYNNVVGLDTSQLYQKLKLFI